MHGVSLSATGGVVDVVESLAGAVGASEGIVVGLSKGVLYSAFACGIV